MYGQSSFITCHTLGGPTSERHRQLFPHNRGDVNWVPWHMTRRLLCLSLESFPGSCCAAVAPQNWIIKYSPRAIYFHSGEKSEDATKNQGDHQITVLQFFSLPGGLLSYLQQNARLEDCLQTQQPKTAVVTSQESRDQTQPQEPTMILAYGSKREILSCWLPLFCRFSHERALLWSQVQYKICSTWLYPCLWVFKDVDLKGYPMSLSQPLTGQ